MTVSLLKPKDKNSTIYNITNTATEQSTVVNNAVCLETVTAKTQAQGSLLECHPCAVVNARVVSGREGS